MQNLEPRHQKPRADALTIPAVLRNPGPPEPYRGLDGFPVTQWSLVAALRGAGSAPAGRAMSEICQRYWYPLYAYARHQGLSREDAQDCTQGFFCSLITRDSLRGAAPEGGLLRAFLLAAMKRHMAGEFRSRQAQKRGSGAPAIPIDPHWAEKRLREEPARAASPDQMFDLRWAHLLLAAAMDDLRAWYVRMRHAALFDAIRPFLEWNQQGPPYQKVALDLRTTESAVRGAVFSMRQRFRQILERKVRETVNTAAEARDEMAVLCRTLTGNF